MSVLSNWGEVLRTANLSPDKHMDTVSRWLIITRAAVFTMTLTSGLIGGLLAAAYAPAVRWDLLLLAVVGLVAAHAANNMINDYFDLEGGVDTSEYARALYAPHPILGGLISKAGLRRAILIVNALDAALMVYLISVRGWTVLLFALAGLFISVFYVAPPIRLKHIGLGELGVLLVWGPLMIGGVYFVAAGELPAWVWGASLPYALLTTTVLIGKHVDKLDQDKARGIHTLPVLLGDGVSRGLNVALMILFYALVVGLVLLRWASPWTLISFLAVGRLVRVIRTYREPKPTQPPPDYPVWPLWYVSAAFWHNKLAGALFVLGLIAQLILPLKF